MIFSLKRTGVSFSAVRWLKLPGGSPYTTTTTTTTTTTNNNNNNN